MKQKIYLKRREEWRDWLQEHHENEKEIWLIYYKKHTGKPRIPYDDAVEEAICFGWIDSTVTKLDEETYAQKFTPRKRNSNWSALNLKRAGKMIREGKMIGAGLNSFNGVKLSEKERERERIRKNEPLLPPFIKEELEKHTTAMNHFNSLAPSYRKLYIRWIESAKREETRKKRLEEAIELLKQGKKLGMK